MHNPDCGGLCYRSMSSAGVRTVSCDPCTPHRQMERSATQLVVHTSGHASELRAELHVGLSQGSLLGFRRRTLLPNVSRSCRSCLSSCL